jgi:hypothetical protein
MDDMMTLSLENERGARSQDLPRVGYPIRVLYSKKRARVPGATTTTRDLKGLDIYRLPHGTTVHDATDGSNGASKWTYSLTNGPDSEIHILPEDLGIASPSLWDGYRLPVSDIFDEMNCFHKERQDNGLDT